MENIMNWKLYLKSAAAVFAVMASLTVFAVETTELTASGNFNNPDTVPLLTEKQKSFLFAPREERITKFADKKSREDMAKCGYYPMTVVVDAPKSKAVVLKEAQTNLPSKSITLNGKTYTVPKYVLVTTREDGTIELGNLKIATLYHWQGEGKECGAFRTEDVAPRLMRVDGVPNARDIGGRKGLNGKRVKQGLVYRSAGLNENAGRKRMTPKEIYEGKNKHKAAVLKFRMDMMETLSQLQRAGAVGYIYVPYSLKKDWVSFRPSAPFTEKDLEAIATLKDIPAELMGSKAQSMTQNDAGALEFEKHGAAFPAVFMQKFDAPSDGLMQLTVGADWFFRIYVNGKLQFDLIDDGNNKKSAADNWIINVRVKKGSNLIVVPMYSGADGWKFFAAAPKKEVDLDDLIKSRMDFEKKLIDKLLYSDKIERGAYRLNQEMVRYSIEDIGLKSDIDLRSYSECTGMNESPAGKNIKWYHYTSACYEGMSSDFGKLAFTAVFRVFLDEKNYPLVFHCIAGQDRTGAVAFIINALLGVEEEELFRDWEATGFWNKKTSLNHVDRFLKLFHVFDVYPGKTINERVENYILDIGFTQDDIAKLRSIMLEQ